mmetsp:Transcript_73144/g.117949  ORF Transcript_73144/g.117949 Transcript_73144/m.117949 type:complete len:201 (-) Transcript_73144:1014-1616(-)
MQMRLVHDPQGLQHFICFGVLLHQLSSHGSLFFLQLSLMKLLDGLKVLMGMKLLQPKELILLGKLRLMLGLKHPNPIRCLHFRLPQRSLHVAELLPVLSCVCLAARTHLSITQSQELLLLCKLCTKRCLPPVHLLLFLLDPGPKIRFPLLRLRFLLLHFCTEGQVALLRHRAQLRNLFSKADFGLGELVSDCSHGAELRL